MTESPVAANLAMIFVIAAGLLAATSLPQRTFPEFTLDQIRISVVYTGASPEEIEQSIIRPIEDQLSGIDGVDEMTATASEGLGTVSLELKLGEDTATKLDEVKAEVDRILDKINTSGFGALTDEEKRILDRAKDMLNRR